LCALTLMAMFEWVTHSKTRVRMLKMFFKDPDAPLYGLEIAQALKASPGTTHRELNAMLKQGIISKKKEGALVLYRLNTTHPYYFELKKAIFPTKKKTHRVLFLSDLHLSIDTKQDLIDDLYLFCEYAQENASEVVLVGDIIEMMQGDVFQTYLLHKPLFDRLTQLSHQVKVTYLVGNHDCFLRTLCEEGEGGRFFDAKVKFGVEYHDDKLNIFATHGHRYDDFSQMKAKKSAYSTNGDALLKAIKKSDLDYDQMLSKTIAEYASQAGSYIEALRANKDQRHKDLMEVAKELIQEDDYSYVVMGHTHKATLKQMDHGIYFNTGSWKSEKKRHFVEIDRDGGALVAIDDLR